MDAKEQELINALAEVEHKRDEIIRKRDEAEHKLDEVYRKRSEAVFDLREYRKSNAQKNGKAGYAVTNADSRKGMR